MLLHNLSDKDLVSSYINGNPVALDELVNRHQSRVLAFINSKVRNLQLAEDIFQDAFFKVIKSLNSGKYNEEGKFLPWAMRIAHNLVIDYFRKANKVRLISESSSQRDDFNIFHTLKLDDENAHEGIMREELESQMVDLIEYLPDTQRDILKMRIFKEMSFKDIADLENISINTALGRMRYALINLRKMIDKHELVVHY